MTVADWGLFRLHRGDCLDVLRALPENSVDSIVTDPPYGLTANKKGGTGAASVNLSTPHGRARIGTGNGAGGFMGLAWDSDVPPVEVWVECLRVLKPGGYLLAFAGTRTQHRMATRIEDAGFEIRDLVAWVYGSGFPKSLDVSKAIDKAAGVERTERLAPKPGHENFVGRDNLKGLRDGTNGAADGGFARPWMDDPQKVEDSHWDFAPATEAARQWQGWGTALKPSLEPITLARKPLASTSLSSGSAPRFSDGWGLPPDAFPNKLVRQNVLKELDTMKADDRKAKLLAAAVRLAKRKGFANLRRDDIAVEAGVSFALVTARLGTMTSIKRDVMREAIRLEELKIVGQGLAMRDPHALKAPDELKDRAVQWIAACAGR